jgi:hypothetical protein
LKTGDELEIYEIDQASKDKMEEICDLRQPVLFECYDDAEKIINTTNKKTLLKNYPVFEIKIRDNKHDKNGKNENGKNENEKNEKSDTDICVPLPLHVAVKLFEEDKNAIYFSENNLDFLQETGAIKNMSYNDDFLRPYLVSNRYYDVIMASTNTETPFRYDLNYRNYYIVTQGAIKVKLAPPKSSKYLYPVNDYENFEFRSAINPWDPQMKFKADFDKIKCLEIVLTPGRFLFIPAYWWYSFKFTENTSVSCFKYRTYMNNIAISPQIFMYALQNQNVERKFTRSIDISKSTLKDEGIKENELVENNNDQSPVIHNTVIQNQDNKEQTTFIENDDHYSSIPDILMPPTPSGFPSSFLESSSGMLLTDAKLSNEI